MKSKSIIISKLIACLSLIAMCLPSAFAAGGNWNVNADGNWNTPGNWNPAAVPGTVAGDVVGLTFDITAPRTVTLNVTATNGILNIGDPTPPYFAYTLAGSSMLTLTNVGGSTALNQLTASGVTDVISAPITLADNLTVNNSSFLTLSGGIAGTGFGLTGAGPGTLTLSGSSSYTGTTTVNGGTLLVPVGGVINSGVGNYLINVGTSTGTAILTIAGGTVNAGNGTTFLGGVNVGTGAGSVGVINLSSGSLNISSAQLLLGAGGAGNNAFGALNMSGGSLNAANGLTLSRSTAATGNYNGELILSGGTITIGGGQFSIGGYQNANNLNVATLTGGSITNAVNTYVGEASGSGGAKGVLNVMGNAVLTITNTAAALQLGVNAGGSGIVNLNGGAIVVPTVFHGAGANGFSNYFNFNGGTLKFNALATNAYSANVVSAMNHLDGAFVWGGNAIIDDSGTNIVITQALLAPTGSGVSTNGLSFSGSGFAAPPLVDIDGTGSGATAIAMIDGTGNLTNVAITCPGVNYTGTPTFTFIGGGSTVTQSGSATTVANVSGGLVKTNTGTLELDGVNTYTGTTVIRGGTFNIGSSTVANGSLLGGGNYPGNMFLGSGSVVNYNGTNVQTLSGSISSSGSPVIVVWNGTVLINSNMNLSGGWVLVTNSSAAFGGTGTITGNVNWGGNIFGGATNCVTVNSVGGTNASPLIIAGNVTLNGPSPVLVNVLNTPLQPGIYTLMTNVSGGIIGANTFAAQPVFAGAGVVAGTTAFITTGSKSVTLTVAYVGTVSVWTNGVNGNWSVAPNWSSNPNVPHLPTDVALFGAGSSNITVRLDASESVGVLNFTNPSSFKIADAGGYTLTLDFTNGGASMSASAGTSNSIGTKVSMNDNVGVWLYNGASISITNVVSSISTSYALSVNGLNGGGTLALSGNNTYGPASGTVGTTLGSATLQLGNSNALSTGDLNIAANATVQAGAAVSVSNNMAINAAVATVDSSGYVFALAGAITGPGALTKIGSGTLTLSGTGSSFTGPATVNAGTLQAGSGSAFGTTAVVVNSAGTLDLNGQIINTPIVFTNSNGATLANYSAGSATNLGVATGLTGYAVNVKGTGNMRLIGLTASVYNGQYANFDVTNNLAGTLDLAGTSDNAFTTLHNYAGTVLLDKASSSGTHALSGLDLEGGTVRLAGTGGDQVFNGNAFVVNAGTFDMNGLSETVTGLAGTNGLVVNNASSTTSTLTLGGAATNVFSGSINNGAAGSGVVSLLKTNSGILTLSGTNTFSGLVQAGGNAVLSVSSVSNALGRVSGIVLGGGAGSGTLLYTGLGESSDRLISFTATNAGAGQVIDQSGAGLLKFTTNLVNTGTVANTLTLQGSTAGAGEIAGNIPNGPLNTNLTSLVKAGSGTWTLSGTNTASGSATVNAGALQLKGNGGTNWAGSIVVNNNATLAALGTTPTVASNVTWAAGSSAALTLNWNGSANTALLKVGGTVALNNNPLTVTLGTSVGNGIYPLMTYNAGSSGTFDGANVTIAGAGLAANTGASLVVNGGYLNLVVRNTGVWINNGNGLWTTGPNWSINPGYPQTAGDGAVFGVGSGLTTVNLAGNKTVGSIAFTNANSFVITNSTSTLTVDNAGYGTSFNVTAGTSNAITAPVIMNETTTLNVAGAKALTLSGSVGGSGGVIVGGAGTATLGGSNTYSGVTTVNLGTLALGSTNAVSTNSLVMNGGSLDSSVPNLVNGKNNPQSWNANFGFVGSQNLNLGTGNVALVNAGVTVTVNSNTLAVGGAISGAGGLTLQGTNGGALELDGVNTFAWFTNVSGTVALGSDAALGTNATIQLSPVQGVTSVAFRSKDAATRTVTNNVNLNTVDGPYVMNGTGNLVFSGTMATGPGQKRFTVNNYTTFSGPLTDGGAPTGSNIKDGTGILALNANNTSKKNWTLNGGTLALGNAGGLGLGALTISNGGLDATVASMILTNAQTWGGNFYFVGSQSLNMGTNAVTMTAPTAISVSNNTLTVAGPVSLTRQLTKSGPGTLVLSGVNTNGGGIVLNAGILTLGGGSPTAALGTGTLTINGGTLSCSANTQDANTNAMVWNGGFGFASSASGALTLLGNATMNANITITNVNSVRNLILKGNISGPGYSLTKTGSGTVLLYGTNNYGNTIVNGGTLTIYQPTLNTNSTVSIVTGTLSLQFTPATTTNMIGALVLAGASQPAGTYKYGNGYLLVVPPPPGPTGPGYLTNLLSGTTMNLSWPGGQGWRLQAQTNGINIGISNNWHYVTDGSVSSFGASVNPANPTVFYRLTYP